MLHQNCGARCQTVDSDHHGFTRLEDGRCAGQRGRRWQVGPDVEVVEVVDASGTHVDEERQRLCRRGLNLGRRGELGALGPAAMIAPAGGSSAGSAIICTTASLGPLLGDGKCDADAGAEVWLPDPAHAVPTKAIEAKATGNRRRRAVSMRSSATDTSPG